MTIYRCKIKIKESKEVVKHRIVIICISEIRKLIEKPRTISDR